MFRPQAPPAFAPVTSYFIDWASEAGLETCTFDTLQRGGAELDDLLHRMAQWLFNV